MSISIDFFPEAIERAFRAALLLTGSTALAEAAVLRAIAELEFTGDVEVTLVATTVELIRQRSDYAEGLEYALARLPHEFQQLMRLPPDARDCFLLRLLFGVPAARCAAILDLTIDEFEDSLCLALRQLPALGCSDPARSGAIHTGTRT